MTIPPVRVDPTIFFGNTRKKLEEQPATFLAPTLSKSSPLHFLMATTTTVPGELPVPLGALNAGQISTLPTPPNVVAINQSGGGNGGGGETPPPTYPANAFVFRIRYQVRGKDEVPTDPPPTSFTFEAPFLSLVDVVGATDNDRTTIVAATTIDWGDGSPVQNLTPGTVTTPILHDFDIRDASGNIAEYVIQIVGSVSGLSFVNEISLDAPDAKPISATKVVNVIQWGGPTMIFFSPAFRGCYLMSSRSDDAASDTMPALMNRVGIASSGTPFSLPGFFGFFQNSGFNQDISRWNVAGVKVFSRMFEDNLAFNGDINGWDVSEGTHFIEMFFRARSFNRNLNSWNTQNAQFFTGMFLNASSFDGDVSSWKTSNVTNMAGMFRGASSFNSVVTKGTGPNAAVWNTSNVSDMSNMFNGAEIFNQDLNSWNVLNVTNFNGFLQNATRFDKNCGFTLGTSSNIEMKSMFDGASRFTGKGVGSWDVSRVVNMQRMFAGATQLQLESGASDTLLDVTGWVDFSTGLKNMEEMFGTPKIGLASGVGDSSTFLGVFLNNVSNANPFPTYAKFSADVLITELGDMQNLVDAMTNGPFHWKFLWSVRENVETVPN